MSASTSGNGRPGGPGPLALEEVAANLESERAVLGSLLLTGEPVRVLRLLDRLLIPECFYWQRERETYEAIVALAKRKIAPDPLTIAAEMERLQTKDDNTELYLDGLTAAAPASGNVLHYADRIIELATWRKRRRVAQEMLEATDKRDPKGWVEAISIFDPTAAPRSNGSTMLRLVDAEGTVVGQQEKKCEGCQELEDQLAGAQTEINGWRARHANLKRDVEKEAREDAAYLVAQALFKEHQQATKRTRTKWSADRFYLCLPYLKRYGAEAIERAIAGISFDPWTKKRRNGTERRYDYWEWLFKDTGTFEEALKSAEPDWQPSGQFSPDKEEEHQLPTLKLSEAS